MATDRIRPFTIAVPPAAVDDLASRLARSRLPDELDAPAWSWGTDRAFLAHALDHWAHRFDWRAQEARLNELPQFIAELDDAQIHFVHVRGEGDRTVPLLLSHGWPGSFAEMLRVLPLLTRPADGGLAFDLVIPSLPGFGFSSRATAPGMSPARIGPLFTRLMRALGYERFGVQGGDLGAGISLRIALAEPDAVLGVHLNYPNFVYEPQAGEQPTPAGLAADARRADWIRDEGAYAHVHATRPQTLGYALNDSPAGLAAWILEKFHAWSDRAAGGMPFALDELLTNISIYWFTQTITSSMRIYREGTADPLVLSAARRIEAPLGVALFPCELPTQPRERVERVANLVRWTEPPRGGHFAALEEPALLADDVRSFFADR